MFSQVLLNPRPFVGTTIPLQPHWIFELLKRQRTLEILVAINQLEPKRVKHLNNSAKRLGRAQLNVVCRGKDTLYRFAFDGKGNSHIAKEIIHESQALKALFAFQGLSGARFPFQGCSDDSFRYRTDFTVHSHPFSIVFER